MMESITANHRDHHLAAGHIVGEVLCKNFQSVVAGRYVGWQNDSPDI
jgi:hypothetical protein